MTRDPEGTISADEELTANGDSVPTLGSAPAAPAGGAPASAGVAGVLRQVAVQPVTFKDADDDPNPTGVSWPTRYGWTGSIWGKLGLRFTAANPVEIVSAGLKTAGGDRASRDKVRASWNGAAVGVFLVDNDVADAGGGGTVGGGAAGAKIALSDRGASLTLLAHEMGHVLGLGHPPGDADSSTVMEPSASNEADNPARNTLDNYNRIRWPAASGSVVINPDP